MVALVCSVCGSSNIIPGSMQPSLGDPAHPLARCLGHQQKQGLSPLCTPAEFTARVKRQQQATPEDVFGDLPGDELAALRRPVKLL